MAKVPIELTPLGGAAGASTTSLPPPYDNAPGMSASSGSGSGTGPGGPARRVPPPPPPRNTNTNTNMETETAPGGLGSAYRAAEQRARVAVHNREGGMDAASVYGLVVAGWFAAQALPALLFPRFVLFMGQSTPAPNAVSAPPERPYDTLTALETWLLQAAGFGLVALAALVLFTIVPSHSPPVPGRTASITVIAILCCTCAVVGWNAPLGALATILGLGNAVVGAWGWWTLFFGEDPHHFKKYLKEDSRFKRL